MPKPASTVKGSQVTQAHEKEKKRVQALMYNHLFRDQDAQLYLVEKVLNHVATDEANRATYMANVEEIRDLYEGKRPTKKDPFENCSNVRTMITAMVWELLHTKLFPLAYSDDLTYWIPQESSDIAQADGVSKFMRWALRSPIHFGDFADDYTHGMVGEGTTASKVTWVREFRWVQRRVPKVAAIMRKVIRKFQNMLGVTRDIQLEERDYDVKYEYKLFQKCKVELVPLEDIGFPSWSIPGSDENLLQHIWHRTRPFIGDLKKKAAQGYFVNINKLEAAMELKMTEEGILQQAKADAEGSQFAVDTKIKMETYPLELIEDYFEVDVPGMGLMECIVWVEKVTKTFAGIMPLVHVSRKNRRPFVIGQLIRRAHRMYGKTILDFIKELEKEADTIHNQRLDAGTMSIVPPFVFRASSGTEPEELKTKPGLGIPVDDINDIKWMQIPNNTMVSFQEERMLFELVEKITSVGSYQSGQESDINRSRATARGTMAIIAQGEQRFQVLGKRIQAPISRILLKVLEMYQQNIEPGLEERVLGEDGQKIFPQGISVEDLAGNFDVIQAMDSTGGSKLLQKAENMELYGAFVQNPFVLNNPSGFWELSAMVARDRGKVDPEIFLGPKPQVQGQQSPGSGVQRNINEIIQGRIPKTEAGENPMMILVGLLAYKSSPEGLMLEPEKRAVLDARIATTRLEIMNQMQNAKSMAQVAEGLKNARGQGLTQGPNMGVLAGPGMEGAGTATPATTAPGPPGANAGGPEVREPVGSTGTPGLG